MSIRWTRLVPPRARLVLVRVRMMGPLGREVAAKLVPDTGTPVTILDHPAAQRIDLTQDRSLGVSRLLGPTGPQEGYRISVARLIVMNRTLTDFVLRCHRLEPRLDVDGILGMDILSQGELKLNLPQGQVEFTWA